MDSEIITIGDEILIGQVIDTNSAFLASELNKLGISVIQITSVADTRESIMKALDLASKRATLVIITGGLGPTSDDITKPVLAEYFKTRLVENQAVVEQIRSWLSLRGVAMSERNRKQAELPENCELLNNSEGSAQGMWFIRDGVHFISLPGVPFEMKAIYFEQMVHRLKERFSLPLIRHITILTHGVPESVMANMLQKWEEKLPNELKLAYLPSPGILRLRITGKSPGSPDELTDIMEVEKKKLEEIIGPHIFGYNDEKLEEIIGSILKKHGFTLSVAESCTGGAISKMITSVAGSSAYFKGGTVAYSDNVKINELNVSPYTLMVNGAVSQAVVEQMAEGARNRFSTDYSVAVSGIAGPDGGTAEKPVGTTWIAISSKKRVISKVYNFGEDRGRNVQKASIEGLFMLKNEIMSCF